MSTYLRTLWICFATLSHAIEPPPTTTHPVIVTEQHLNATLPPVPLNEFANDHMVDAENDRSSTITAQQIVDKIWTRENADGSTHTIAPPEQIDPLAAPDLSMPSASGAADSTDAANEGFDVSDLSLYDQALSTNRGAVEQHATTQEQIGVRLNSTMALLAPLRQTLKQLKATELQYKKELQILKLQAKHDIIVSRAVAPALKLVKLTKDALAKSGCHIFIKGGDLTEEKQELLFTYKNLEWVETPLNSVFEEDFFETKKVIKLTK